MHHDDPASGTYNLDYRPPSYWATPDAILANIKGEQRRRLVRRALKIGDAEKLQQWMLRDKLSAADRRMIGRIHPLFMGGEYLPDYGQGEIEIARVSL